MNKHFQLLALLLLAHTAFAQSKKPGEILIQLERSANLRDVVRAVEQATTLPVTEVEPTAVRWSIYNLHLDPSMLPDEGTSDQLMRTLRGLPGIAAAQWNHEVEERDSIPNDALWIEQRDMSLIGLKTAWENTTGGLTPAGDTIVVAVLEKGIQKDHPDLAPNLWRNYGEIPDNNIDDDNNGYIDDYLGWDAGTGQGDGNGNGSSHGTSVCGIIGAKGNDSWGVAGVNWNVQMMTFVNVRFEDEIIAAYNYAGEMRRLYNESNGQKGAFVVVTNASFGIDNAFAADYPLWCAVYDSLGQIGVLSVAATANASRDVDVQGDMPTTCTSEYLITVTNVDAYTGKRMTNAGYGSVSIDMGSPGQNTYTTINRTITQTDTLWHGSFGGTSASCPHGSGAVALLYSVACTGFVADAISHPVNCALRVRDAVLLNVTSEATMEGVSTTGGRLDVAASIEDIMELCSGTTGPLDLVDLRPNPVSTTLEIRYQTPDYGDYTLRIFNDLGQLISSETFSPPSFEAKRKLIEVQNWPSGVYFVAFSQGKTQTTKKFVKI